MTTINVGNAEVRSSWHRAAHALAAALAIPSIWAALPAGLELPP